MSATTSRLSKTINISHLMKAYKVQNSVAASNVYLKAFSNATKSLHATGEERFKQLDGMVGLAWYFDGAPRGGKAVCNIYRPDEKCTDEIKSELNAFQLMFKEPHSDVVYNKHIPEMVMINADYFTNNGEKKGIRISKLLNKLLSPI